MNIIKCTGNDALTLEKLFSVLYKPELKWNEDIIGQEIENSDKFYYLVLDDENIVGGFGIKFNMDSGKFGSIVINEPVRNKGIGSQVLAFAEKLVKDRGFKKIWCYSLEKYRAGDFYKKNGWQEQEFIADFWDGQNCSVYVKYL